ncbi:MAG TPA: ABC transporter permease [Vicinamibacterales bacterium]|nr:ABC transporter permease [Vicinamibacterales bacterium]
MRNWEAYVRARLRLPELAPERESRIVRELAAQLEDFYRAAIAQGSTHDEADAHARAQVADWERLARDVRQAERPNRRPGLDRMADHMDNVAMRRRGGWSIMADLVRDIRYAARQLRMNPGFTAVAILTLAVGIGSTTAIFSVVNGVLLRPLPYAEPDRLVRVHEIVPQYGRFSVAPATFLDWRRQNTVFERIAAFSPGSGTITDASGPERVSSAGVSWDMFDLLKVEPTLGRRFIDQEGTPGRNDVIVISHGMWQQRFGGERSVLGRAVTLNGRPASIVGVMPAGFYFPSRETQIWTPLAFDPAKATRGGHFLGVIARTRAGVSVEQAGAEIKTISERLARQYPASSANESAEVVALHENVVGRVRPALLTLLAAVGVVVLIACANVANLLLVRASARGKEIAIRSALGAGRRRLARQMLVESLALALAGGALGVLLAYFAVRPIQVLGAGSVPRVNDVSIDATVLAFAVLLSLATGALFGLAPSWHASRADVAEVLKDGARSSSSARGGWIRGGLLVAQVALSMMLLVGATLLLRSFVRVTSVDPGFRADHVLAFRLSLPRSSYPEFHNLAAFYDRLLQELHARPDVKAAGIAQTLPMRGDYMLSFSIEGRPVPQSGVQPSANYRAVTPGYFEALSIPLVRGRAFTARDAANAPMVAIVDRAFVRRHFPSEEPIGRRIDIGNGTDGFYEVVGVVGDVRHDSLDAAPGPTMYVPMAQDLFGDVWVVARATGDPAGLAPEARAIVRKLDPGLPAYSAGPLAEVLSEAVATRRFSMLLLVAFALSALFLSAVGLYGVVAYSVSQRTTELGVRMAMGARPADLLRMVLAYAMKLTLGGLVIGLAGSLALSRWVASLLFEVTPFDPVSYAATAVVLLAVATLAGYVPARRATRLDPLFALRQA